MDIGDVVRQRQRLRFGKKKKKKKKKKKNPRAHQSNQHSSKAGQQSLANPFRNTAVFPPLIKSSSVWRIVNSFGEEQTMRSPLLPPEAAEAEVDDAELDAPAAISARHLARKGS